MRRFFVLCLLFALLMGLCACTESKSTADFQRNADSLSLPVGIWYQSEAKEWETGYLPDALRSIFFEDGMSFPWVMYLGTDDEVLCEILYAVLPSEYDALMLAAHLSARIETLKELSDGAFDESLSDASVLRCDNAVLYTVSPVNIQVLALLK